jgi:hypothetical protein
MKLGDMYIDYVQGMPRRAMEQKYDVSYGTIIRKCKEITIKLFTDNDKFIYQNVEKIKKDVDAMADEVNACKHCGQPKNFFGDNFA